LDMAINGDGFFAVQTAGGVRYTRNGEFQSDEQGRLVTAMGDPVLGRDNQPVRIGNDGKVDPRNLNVVLLTNPEKAGSNLITGTPGAAAGLLAGSVRAGALEGSGADANQAMVDMIESMRAYEAGQKVIHTIDETLGKAASSVGSLSS
jgi:flagellar basal-body rod protein FlgF